MIQEVKMYSVICDNCKEVHGDEVVAYADADMILDSAMSSDWITVDAKQDETEADLHYCPSCFTIDGDDNIKLNHERAK